MVNFSKNALDLLKLYNVKRSIWKVMSASTRYQTVIVSSLVLGALSMPFRAEASRFQEWANRAQQGVGLIKRGIQIRNQASGGNEGYQQAPQEPAYQPPPSGGSPNSPGSNYYNIDPSTMRNPTRHAQPEAPQEPPAYTPPPTYQHSSGRSAYHTGSEEGVENQSATTRMPAYVPARKAIRGHAVVKHLEKPERAAVAVIHQPDTSKLPVIDKPDVLKPDTAADTTWILPTLDRVEAKLRKGSG